MAGDGDVALKGGSTSVQKMGRLRARQGGGLRLADNATAWATQPPGHSTQRCHDGSHWSIVIMWRSERGSRTPFNGLLE